MAFLGGTAKPNDELIGSREDFAAAIVDATGSSVGFTGFDPSATRRFLATSPNPTNCYQWNPDAVENFTPPTRDGVKFMTTTSVDSFGICVVQSVHSLQVLAESVWARILSPSDHRTFFCLTSLRSRPGRTSTLWLKVHARYMASHVALSGDHGVVIPPTIPMEVDGKMTTNATIGSEWQLFAPETEPQHH